MADAEEANAASDGSLKLGDSPNPQDAETTEKEGKKTEASEVLKEADAAGAVDTEEETAAGKAKDDETAATKDKEEETLGEVEKEAEATEEEDNEASRDVEPRPFSCTYQEAVWAILLRALHAACEPLSDGVKRMLRRAYGKKSQRWVKIVREPLSRRMKEICYADDEWHIEMACQVMENELDAFVDELLPIEPDEPDPMVRMTLVGQEVERVRFARTCVLEGKTISAIEAKEAVLALRRLLKRTGSQPDRDPLESSIEILDNLHQIGKHAQTENTSDNESEPIEDQDTTPEDSQQKPVDIASRDVSYVLLLRLFKHMETVLPKVIPNAAKKTDKREFDDMRGPFSDDLQELLSFIVHDDPAMELVFLLMEDKYRTPDMKLNGYTVAKVRALLWKHLSIPIKLLAQALDAAHKFLSVCCDAADVELGKVEGWLDDYRHCVRPRRYRELRYRRRENDGGEVEVILSDVPKKTRKQILIDMKEIVGRKNLLETVADDTREMYPPCTCPIKPIVLCGPHGIGKTALAIEIARQFLRVSSHQYIIHASTIGTICSDLLLLLITEGWLVADKSLTFDQLIAEFSTFLQTYPTASLFIVLDDCSDPSLIQPITELLEPHAQFYIITALLCKPWKDADFIVHDLPPLSTHESLGVIKQAMDGRRGELGVKGGVKYTNEVYDVPDSRALVAEVAEVHLGNIPLSVRFMGCKLLQNDVRPKNLVEKLLDFQQPALRRTDRLAGGAVHVKGYRTLVRHALKKIGDNNLVKQLAYTLSLLSSRRWNTGFIRLLAFNLGVEKDGTEECHLLEEHGLIRWTSESNDSFVMDKLIQMQVSQQLGEEEAVGKVSRDCVMCLIADLADALEVMAHGEARLKFTVHNDFSTADFEQLVEDALAQAGELLTDEQLLELTAFQIQCMRQRNAHTQELSTFLKKLEDHHHTKKIIPPLVIEEHFNEQAFTTTLWSLPDKDVIETVLFITEQLDEVDDNETRLRLFATAMRCLADKQSSQQAVIELANKVDVTQSLLISLMNSDFGDVITTLALSLGQGLLRQQMQEVESFVQELLKKLAQKNTSESGRSEAQQAIVIRQHLHIAKLCALLGQSYRNSHQSNHSLKWYGIARETLLSLPKKSYCVKEMIVDINREALHTCALMSFLDTQSAAVVSTLQSLREDLHLVKLPLSRQLLIGLADALFDVVKQRKDDLQKSAQQLLKVVLINQVCNGPHPPYPCLLKAIKAALALDDKQMFQTLFFKAVEQLATKPTTKEHAMFVYDLFECLRSWYRQHFDKDVYCDVSVALLCIVDDLFLKYGFLQVKGKLLVMEMRRGVRRDRAATTILHVSRMCKDCGEEKVAELLVKQHEDLLKPDTPPPSPKPRANDFWGRW